MEEIGRILPRTTRRRVDIPFLLYSLFEDKKENITVIKKKLPKYCDRCGTELRVEIEKGSFDQQTGERNFYRALMCPKWKRSWGGHHWQMLHDN